MHRKSKNYYWRLENHNGGGGGDRGECEGSRLARPEVGENLENSGSVTGLTYYRPHPKDEGR